MKHPATPTPPSPDSILETHLARTHADPDVRNAYLSLRRHHREALDRHQRTHHAAQRLMIAARALLKPGRTTRRRTDLIHAIQDTHRALGLPGDPFQTEAP